MTESRTAGLLGCRFPTASRFRSAAAVHIWSWQLEKRHHQVKFWPGNSLKRAGKELPMGTEKVTCLGYYEAERDAHISASCCPSFFGKAVPATSCPVSSQEHRFPSISDKSFSTTFHLILPL